jgi:hypothetical protein
MMLQLTLLLKLQLILLHSPFNSHLWQKALTT